jgi:hypothetical protein
VRISPTRCLFPYHKGKTWNILHDGSNFLGVNYSIATCMPTYSFEGQGSWVPNPVPKAGLTLGNDNGTCLLVLMTATISVNYFVVCFDAFSRL